MSNTDCRSYSEVHVGKRTRTYKDGSKEVETTTRAVVKECPPKSKAVPKPKPTPKSTPTPRDETVSYNASEHYDSYDSYDPSDPFEDTSFQTVASEMDADVCCGEAPLNALQTFWVA